MSRYAFIALILFITPGFSVCFGQEPFRYDPKDKRDPFMPLIDKEGNLIPEMRYAASALELNLEGIVWAEEGCSYAVISGVVLRAGDTVGDYTVKRIERQRVILTKAGEEFVMDIGSKEEQ